MTSSENLTTSLSQPTASALSDATEAIIYPATPKRKRTGDNATPSQIGSTNTQAKRQTTLCGTVWGNMLTPHSTAGPSDSSQQPQSSAIPSSSPLPPCMTSPQTPEKGPRKKRKVIDNDPKQKTLGELGITSSQASSAHIVSVNTPSAIETVTPSPSSAKASAAKGRKKGNARAKLAPPITDEELRKVESLVVDAEQMMNQKNLKFCYRLSGQYLKAVPLVGVQYGPRRTSSGLIEKAKTNLYRERDAEFQAWKMHGGREAFLNLYESYLTWDFKESEQEQRVESFPIPNSYESAFKRIWNELEPVAEYQPEHYMVVWTAIAGPFEPPSSSNSQPSPSGNNVAGPSQSPMKGKGTSL